MKNKPEEIPSEVFDWMQSCQLEELSKEQQETVLLYFTREECTEFHFLQKEIKSLIHNECEHKEETRIKLLNRFDEKYAQPRFNALSLWKAAAVFLFCLSVFSFAYLMKRPSEIITREITSTDTVYVEKKIAGAVEKIHDTIYVYQEKTSEKTQIATPADYSAATNEILYFEEEEIDAIPVSELNSDINTLKSNSKKDDSLARKFHVISL